jgi:hypothetical protein
VAAPVKIWDNFMPEHRKSSKHAEQFWVRVQKLTKIPAPLPSVHAKEYPY